MILVVDAIRTIVTMQPAQPPLPARTPVPDMAAVPKLADITGGHADKFARAADSLKKDENQIQDIVGQAKNMVLGCLRDLFGIGLSALQRAIPAALGLLVPNPAVQAAARTALMLIARQAIAEAIMRIKNLIGELASLIPALLAIAARAVQSAISDKGRAATESLKKDKAIAPTKKKALSPPPVPASDHVRAGTAGSSHAEYLHAHQQREHLTDTHSRGNAAVLAAKQQLGKPYVWGGTGNGGFDCSGLTQFAWRQAGVELPRLAQEQTVGRQIHAHELMPGDLVVWDGHVAMYSGEGKIIEAGNPVEESPLRTSNMGMRFKGFWRPTG